MMTETQSGLRKIDIVLLAIIFAVGIFLRLTPDAFSPGASLHFIAILHPQPAFNKIGFDEGLYREYVNALNDGGLGSYPDIVQGYIDVQKKLPGSILPPLRFLYIFTASLWHSLFGSEALEALYPLMILIHVFLDNARYHHAKLVQEWLERPDCRIRLHFIPSYCPHLNPIERLWGLMHRNVTHNKCYATCAQFADATLSFLRDKVPQNWADLCDSVTDNFRVINPKRFRVMR